MMDCRLPTKRSLGGGGVACAFLEGVSGGGSAGWAALARVV
jgi:hypothetical protein